MSNKLLILAFMICLCAASEEQCGGFERNNYGSVSKKSEGIGRVDEMLRRQDEARASYFEEPLRGDETGPEIRTKFYRMTSQPLQVS